MTGPFKLLVYATEFPAFGKFNISPNGAMDPSISNQDPDPPESSGPTPDPKAKALILTSLKAQPACPICGKNSYSWGFVRGHYDLKYKDSNMGFIGRITVLGGESVKARKCISCRNIQLFAE